MREKGRRGRVRRWEGPLRPETVILAQAVEVAIGRKGEGWGGSLISRERTKRTKTPMKAS